MEFLVALVFAGFLAALWNKVGALQSRLDQLEQEREGSPPPPKTHVAQATAEPSSLPYSDRPKTVVIRHSRAPDTVPPEIGKFEPDTVLPDATEAGIAQAEVAEFQANLERAEGHDGEESEDYERSEYSKPSFSFDFEDIFGRRLPIWAGGIALAIAGIFLVRYSIEAGLVTPAIRVALSFLFGLSLLGAAEAAYRFDLRVGDERVRQSLAGAGLATLFGAFYLAGSTYGLIGAASAFLGLAAVTAAAIALSFRFGLPCAVLGLLGGFAAPVMVESDQANVPLLALYLGLVTAGLAWTGRAQDRPWLGYAALAAGLSWGFILLLSGIEATGDILAFGGYLVVLGTALPAFMRREDGPNLAQLAAGGIATYQMGALVERAGFAPLTWALYLLIGAALAFLGWRRAELRPGSAIAAAIGIALLTAWPVPNAPLFALVAAIMAGIFAGVPLALDWKDKANSFDRLQLALVPLAIGLAAIWQFDAPGDSTFQFQLGAAMAGLAVLPAWGAALFWKRNEKLALRTSLILLGSTSILAFAAALLVTPSWLTPIIAALIALGMCQLMRVRAEKPLTVLAWVWAAATLATLVLTPDFSREVLRLWNEPSPADPSRALIRWLATLLPFIGLAWLHRDDGARHGPEAIGAVLLYGAIAQFLPGMLLAWLAAAGAVAFLLLQSQRQAAWGVFAVIALGWSVPPVVAWLGPAVMALTSHPMMAGDAIEPLRILRVLLPIIVAAFLISWRAQDIPKELRQGVGIAAGAISTIALHSLYKQVWAIESLDRFEMLGMAERTVWQAALLAAAFAAHRLLKGTPCIVAAWALLFLSLSHFAAFTLLLHNPLWAPQQIGSLPILNWLIPAYGVALGVIALAKRWLAAQLPHVKEAADAATMLLIAALALSSLRQFFAGSLLSGTPLGQTEDLLRSLTGILLALGYLWWGGRTGQRSWRVGSLVLMLAAVLKVFLVDAGELEGLLRIASFMALGFSLIGIGWVYTRQLAARPKGETAQ